MTLPAPEICRHCGIKGHVTHTHCGDGYRERRHKCPKCGHAWQSWQSFIDPRKVIFKQRIRDTGSTIG